MSLRSVMLSAPAPAFGNCCPASAEPQLVQKRCPATMRAEQVGQTSGRADPQLPQNRAVTSASTLQLGQVRALLGPAPDRELEGGSAIAATPALDM
jgi:hypothetical protein